MQVADCYISVEHPQLRSGEFERLSNQLYDVATELAPVVKRAHDLDFTFEEGSLIQRILLAGTFLMTSLDAASHYHDLRESVIDAIHDEQKLSSLAIKKFHEITRTKPNQEIYKRTSSRDMNRLHRIVSGFDRVTAGNVSHREQSDIRDEVISDLAGLARANPNDPEIDKIMHLLPKRQFHELPRSAAEALAMDSHRIRRPIYEPREERPSQPHRRRFHKHTNLLKR